MEIKPIFKTDGGIASPDRVVITIDDDMKIIVQTGISPLISAETTNHPTIGSSTESEVLLKPEVNQPLVNLIYLISKLFNCHFRKRQAYSRILI